MAYLDYPGLSHYHDKEIEEFNDYPDKDELSFVDKQFKWVVDRFSGQNWDTLDDTVEGYSKPVASGSKVVAVNKIGGKTVVANQLVKNGNFDTSSYWWTRSFGALLASNNIATITVVNPAAPDGYIAGQNITMLSGHKYLCSIDIQSSMPATMCLGPLGDTLLTIDVEAATWEKFEGIITPTADRTSLCVGWDDSVTITNGNNFKLRKARVVDLTEWFGSGNEPTELTDSKITEIKAYLVDHPEYNTGELVSAEVTEVESLGKNLFDKNATPYLTGYYVSQSGNLYKSANWKIYSIEVESDTDYVFDCSASLSTIPYLRYDDSEHNQLSISKSSINGMRGFVFHSPNNAKYLLVTVNVSNLGIGSMRITKGSSVQPYTPYFTDTLTIPSALLTDHPLHSAWTVHDEYDLENMKHIQRVGSRAYQEGDEDDTIVITDGTTTYYPLESPIETDISLYFDNPDMMLITESGGSITFEQTETQFAIPNDLTYAVELAAI